MVKRSIDRSVSDMGDARMLNLDEAFDRAKLIVAEATANIDGILTEEDAKFQIITRLLVEVLGWSPADLSAERKTENGFADFIVSDRNHNAFVVEAKRIGRIVLHTYAERLQHYKLSGPALADALVGVQQAASYATPLGIQLAVLTDGLIWIVFLPYTPGGAYLERQAVVFPSFDAILSDFADFFYLLSKEHSRVNTYKVLFDKLHENRLTLSTPLVAPFPLSDIHRLSKTALAFDLEKVFSSFFSGMSGDADPDLIVNCFVETKESRIADYALERITSNVLGNIGARNSTVDEGLASIVQSTVDGDLGQTIFIVGPSGAGKSTFLVRFFRKTLPAEIRQRCLLINVNSLDASGDTSTSLDWMREAVINSIEQQSFAEGYPSWKDLRALYHGDYVKRSEGVDAPLYRRDKEAFQEKFSTFVDERVAKDREGYLARLLADSVHNRKKLPVIIIDNTDEFSSTFKEQVFQYFQSLRRSVKHCLLIFPATDRSAWSFSKTEIFNIYNSASFYLPTPSPREVFRKRVDYLRSKVSTALTDKTKASYFTDHGIRISISNLEGFASVVESIFVEQDYAAKRIGELSNYNIRQTLRLAERVITSATLAIDEIITSYVTGEIVTPSPARFMNALLKGDYDLFRSDDTHYVLPIFQVDSEIRQSPLLAVRILSFLQDVLNGSTQPDDRYVAVRSIHSFFELMRVPEPAVERSLTLLLQAGLLEPYDLSVRQFAQDQRLAITFAGSCHLTLAISSPTYFEQMALTTRITDPETADQIRGTYLSNVPLNERFERIRTVFSAYLATEDAKFVSPPSTQEFIRQGSLRSDIVSHWSGVRRTEDAEAMALYGTVAERVLCRVDWFDRYKGYGFVQVDAEKDTAFLPVKVVQSSKAGEVNDGDELICDISRNDKGLIVSKIHEIVGGKGRVYEGSIVKIFEEKGYGFIHVPETKLDAFFHFSLFPLEVRESLSVGSPVLLELTIDADGRGQAQKATLKG